LFLSNVSPLGVPFNSLKDSSNDLIKNNRIVNDKPGSSCPKKFLALGLDAKGKPLCTASKKYQIAQLEELSSQNLDSTTFDKKSKLITDKTCLCEGLANAAIINYNMPHKGEDQGVAICPGPNVAYFTKELSLKEMVRHIYGKTNVITTSNRPHFFIKELSMYVDYFSNKVDEFQDSFTKKQEKYLTNFKNNLNNGIAYYHQLFSDSINNFEASNDNLLSELEQLRKELLEIKIPILQAV